MTVKNRILTVALAVAMGLSCLALPATALILPANASASPMLAITEVCFNPTFQTNTLGLNDTADVLEYVELVNCSVEAVSLTTTTLQRSNDGYEGEFKTNRILAVAEESTVALQPGEVAVVAIYNEDSFKAGLRYETEDDRRAYYTFFTEFYKCAEDVTEDRFFIAPGCSQATGEALTDGFHLTNSAENVVLRLVDKDGGAVCEAAYNAALWNRNRYAVNFTYRSDADAEHPLSTQPLNLGGTTPGVVRDNQLTAEGMTPVGVTADIKVMQYNICATDSEQKREDGTVISMNERITQVLSGIKRQEPDVLGLCEVNEHWVPYLEREFTGAEGVYSGYGRSSAGNIYGRKPYAKGTWNLYNLVLWKTEKYDLLDQGSFWCSSTPAKPNTFTWADGTVGDFARGINWVILKDKATGAEFFFLCAHIDAKVDKARNDSAALILEKATELSGGRPVIMVGDWNSNENKESYDILTGEGFADARYRVPVPADMTLYGTGNGWGEDMEPKNVAAIDHCIITPHNVFVTSATCDLGLLQGSDTLVGSDHNAIVLHIRIPAPQTEGTVSDTDTETETVPVSLTETAPASSAGCGSTLASASLVVAAVLAVGVMHKKES